MTGRLGHLAYGLDCDIYLADWDGTNPVRIVDGTPDPSAGGPNACIGNWGEGPMWSPNGRYFAYRSASGDRCAGTVVINDMATGAVSSFLGTGWRVAWSTDSSRVATWVDLGKTIGIFGPHGGLQALLAVPSGCALPGDFDPVWSPYGQSLVLPACEVPIDGGASRRLSPTDPRSRVGFGFAPNGPRVAYITNGRLVVGTPDSASSRELVGAGASGPLMWSPSGLSIAFTASVPSAPDELTLVNSSSGDERSLVTARGTESMQVLAFSPAGDRVLFSRTDANNLASLWTVHADGSDPQLLVTGSDWGDWEAIFSSP